MPIREDDSQGLDPREYPEPDLSDNGGYLPCPNCLAVIHEEAQRCPRCGEYLSSEHLDRKPRWMVIGVLVCVGLIIYGLWIGVW